MRAYTLLPLAAAFATAFVIPDEQAIRKAEVESNDVDVDFSSLQHTISDAVKSAKGAIDHAFDSAFDHVDHAAEQVVDYTEDEYNRGKAWWHAREHDLSETAEWAQEVSHEAMQELRESSRDWYEDLGMSCRHMFSEVDKDNLHEEEDDDSNHHGRRPHHPHRPHKPTLTVYQLIKKSKYTTKLAALVDEFPEVVDFLNGTKSGFTLFAPTDQAFEKIPHHHKPSKEFLLDLLKYHVVPDTYPAKRVLASRTLPSVLHGEGISDQPHKTPQRIAVTLGLGVKLNYYARLVALDIFGTNGIVHGINAPLFPPLKAATLVQAVPGTFSTLELGLWKTGLFPYLNDTTNHLGGSLFAPSNRAWEALGPRANGFLFSQPGRKYLKALIKYHIVPSTTLYSDKLYVQKKDGDDDGENKQVGEKRTFHIELPTALKGKSLTVDVAEWYRFVDVRINGFTHVAARDLPVYDGVIHIPGKVLVPPKTVGGWAAEDTDDISVEELKERLEAFVEEDDEAVDFDEAKIAASSAEQIPFVMPLEL